MVSFFLSCLCKQMLWKWIMSLTLSAAHSIDGQFHLGHPWQNQFRMYFNCRFFYFSFFSHPPPPITSVIDVYRVVRRQYHIVRVAAVWLEASLAAAPCRHYQFQREHFDWFQLNKQYHHRHHIMHPFAMQYIAMKLIKSRRKFSKAVQQMCLMCRHRRAAAAAH